MDARHDTSHYTLWLEDGIIHSVLKPDTILTLELAKEIVEKRWELTDGITRPMLIDLTGMRVVKGDARKYLAGSDAAKYVSAGAIYLDNYLQYLAGKVFIQVDEPPVPIKLFNEKEQALLWLEQFKSLS